ncbi:hypothetical protein [Microbacterium sp.]|uniref:hypothetical protein n=1 Tax=Microbacterium sp. TaxID=51671 RepID=UPI003A8ECEDE
MDTITRKPIDLESWARSRRNRRSFGPGMMPPRDPIPEVAYEYGTIRQLIYTFTKVNPSIPSRR